MAQSIPTNDLTLAQLFDPAGFTRSRRRFGALKRCAPYVLHEVAGLPGTLIVLDRQYRPLAARVHQGHAVDWAQFRSHHFSHGELNLTAGPRDGMRWFENPGVSGSFWLWKGSAAPYLAPESLARYRLVLLDVFGLAGLARVAALVGRKLGDFPPRAACWDAFVEGGRRWARTSGIWRPAAEREGGET